MDKIDMDNTQSVELVNKFVDSYKIFKKEISKVIVGQNEVVDQVLMSLFCDGHSLLVGVPGLAKTLLIQTISKCLGLTFNRIQFTPDLMPSDIVGSEILDNERQFKFIKGPIFSNIILADEINRTPPKTQAALLEAMQEKSITNSGNKYDLDKPFFVLATQNPIEQEGTYPLPEAQVDRFMLKVVLPYPSREEERLIIRANVSSDGFPNPSKVVDPKQIIKARDIVKQIYMDEKIEKYIVDIVYATREPEHYQLDEIKHFISFGGSPRASISLASAAKAYAFLKKRGYVIPEDVRAVSKDVLRHRIGLSYEAEAENVSAENVITTILNRVEVP